LLPAESCNKLGNANSLNRWQSLAERSSTDKRDVSALLSEQDFKKHAHMIVDKQDENGVKEDRGLT